MALLVKMYGTLPERRTGEAPAAWARRMQAALDKFKREVEARYTEGTLQRLLDSPHTPARQAAALALGLLGTMKANEALAALLHDEDVLVRQLATDALWAIWFRSAQPENIEELQRLMRLSSQGEATTEELLAGYEALLEKAPDFAEAYNQRAILHFRLGEWQKSAADCEKVLKLNPYHFGAAGGLAQCQMKLKRLRPALKAYRRAFRINPNLDGVHDVIQSLERLLGEEGKK
jgi:tetratricopeptide (TPR) repeat protein